MQELSEQAAEEIAIRYPERLGEQEATKMLVSMFVKELCASVDPLDINTESRDAPGAPLLTTLDRSLFRGGQLML